MMNKCGRSKFRDFDRPLFFPRKCLQAQDFFSGQNSRPFWPLALSGTHLPAQAESLSPGLP
jgi:hypothetical protein